MTIQADLHLHTCYSHGQNTPEEMHGAACRKGLALIGFSEHSPRPDGFNYRREYRKKLEEAFPLYIREVSALKGKGPCRVLLGLEMDWLAGEEEFVRRACKAYDYDYIIGSVHFLGDWGFDESGQDWQECSQEVCEKRYRQYFRLWREMLRSGLFQIAAHPDLIKIYSLDQFHLWLQKEEAVAQIRECLLALRNSGMALEISSAGLRKDCRQIYPAPAIMKMAAELELPISMASDAHNTEDVGRDFGRLAAYARSFGFAEQTIFDHGKEIRLPF